ncbi:MAG: transcriptional regulator NrdR [bacterium]
MVCPYCGKNNDKVVDSRSWNNGKAIRRRRLCLNCNRRFITLEEIEDKNLYVIKSDNRRELFNRKKLQKGMQIACSKRPISIKQIEKIVADIENHLSSEFVKEVKSRTIGEMVSKKLKKIDEVAYVRFASVYRKFEDKKEFIQELTKLK